MRGLKSLGAALAAGALLAGAWAGQAGAQIRHLTFQGQLSTLSDEGGLFTPLSFEALSDRSFTATFSFFLQAAEDPNPAVHGVSGGAFINRQPFVTANLTVAGVTRTLANDFFGQVTLRDTGDVRGFVRGGPNGLDDAIGIGADVLPPVVNLGQDFTAMVAAVENNSFFLVADPAGGRSSRGDLLVERVTLASTIPGPLVAAGAVPEPATWALMIGGFGMAGAMLRSRRRVAVVA